MPRTTWHRHVASILAGLALGLALTTPVRAENHALLVGVSAYPNLGKQLQLAGPKNDVALLQTVLERKGFAAANIHVLADGIPGAAEPTRRNIVAALEDLATRAAPGDYIFLHFSGHGSQQPVDPAVQADIREPDGRNEIFLPGDVADWDDELGAVKNAIADYEMNGHITAMRRRGAFVWASFDSCHSGSMTRGESAPAVRYRQASADDLKIPEKAFARAKPSSGAPKGGALGGSADSVPGGFVAIYAAQSTEKAPEMGLPEASPNGKPFGLLSYLLAEVLSNYEGISYRQLGQYLLQRYAAKNMNSPTPLVEGTALDARLLGQDGAPGLRQWPVEAAGNEWRLAAGELNQFSTGAVFAIVPSALSPDGERLGYARAEQVEALRATLVPVSRDGMAALAMGKLPRTAHARLVEPNFSLTLTVARPAKQAKAGPRERTAIDAIDRLKATPPEGVQIAWVDAGQPADLRLELADGRLWLVPPHGARVADGPARTHSIGLDKPKEELGRLIEDSLRRIAKVTNLLRLANGGGTRAKPQLALSATVKRKADGKTEEIDPATPSRLLDGDQVTIAFRNAGRDMLDVTLLYVDANYGVMTLYPEPGRNNRIEGRGEDQVTVGISDDPVGGERLLAIAVEGRKGTAPIDFSFLAQDGMPRTRGNEDNPAVAFLLNAGFGGRTRGAAVPRGLEMQTLNWQVSKQ